MHRAKIIEFDAPPMAYFYVGSELFAHQTICVGAKTEEAAKYELQAQINKIRNKISRYDNDYDVMNIRFIAWRERPKVYEELTNQWIGTARLATCPRCDIDIFLTKL